MQVREAVDAELAKGDKPKNKQDAQKTDASADKEILRKQEVE